MNKTLLLVVGAVVIIAAAIGIWKLGGNAGGGAAVGTNTDSDTTPQTQNTSLRGLLASQGSQRCTFTTTTENANSVGTVYVSNGQMRGDFTSTSGGQTMESHMIVKDGTSYVWTDAMPQGIKMSFEGMSAQGNQATQWFDPNTAVDYSCSSWNVDGGVFVVPTNIEFQDLSALVPAGTP